jgi:hypothetical protein
MRNLLSVAVLAMFAGPAAAQQAPVSDALRMYLQQFSRNLVAASDDFPASKFSYKPTSPQQSVGTVVDHLAGSNNFLCASVAGVAPPTVPAVKPDSTPPDTLRARLRRSFTFCETVLKNLDDSKLSDSVPWFSGKRTRANVILALPYDWADHYSQMANYLRLNGISPPNARARAVPVP